MSDDGKINRPDVTLIKTGATDIGIAVGRLKEQKKDIKEWLALNAELTWYKFQELKKQGFTTEQALLLSQKVWGE